MGLGVRPSSSVWHPGCCDKAHAVPRTPRNQGLPAPRCREESRRAFGCLGVRVVSGFSLSRVALKCRLLWASCFSDRHISNCG